MFGLALVAVSNSVPMLCVSVFFIGIGSSILHPEASRVTSLASSGHRGAAQSIFQVGGNFGSSLGPLLVAAIVAPFGRSNMAWFCLIALIAIIISRPRCRWYGSYLASVRQQHTTLTPHRDRPLSLAMTIFAIGVITILIFSKYIYMASLTNYFTFYLMEKFGVSVSVSQVSLFVFLFATAAGTLVGIPLATR